MDAKTTSRHAKGQAKPQPALISAAEANPDEEELAGSWVFDLLFDLLGAPVDPPHRDHPEPGAPDSKADNARQA